MLRFEKREEGMWNMFYDDDDVTWYNCETKCIYISMYISAEQLITVTCATACSMALLELTRNEDRNQTIRQKTGRD